MDEQAIDAIVAAFYRAFANPGGDAIGVDTLYDLFLSEARIIKNVGRSTEICGLEEFVEPRRSLLSGGSIVDFEEHEIEGRTDVFGNIAQRFSRYRKSWTSDGKPSTGGGTKSLQFVRTGAGWKIASLIWDDDA